MYHTSIPIFKVTGNNKTQPGPHAKCPTFLPDHKTNLKFLKRLSRKPPISSFTEIRPVGAELIQADRWTDEGPHITSVEGNHIWRFTVSGNNKKYLNLHARCLKLCTTLTTSGFSREIFVKAVDIKFHGNPFSGRRTDIYGQTDKSFFASMRTRPNRGARKVTDGTRFTPEKGISSKKQFSDFFHQINASTKIIPYKVIQEQRQCCYLQEKAGKGGRIIKVNNDD
jgi:hypothetical protein